MRSYSYIGWFPTYVVVHVCACSGHAVFIQNPFLIFPLDRNKKGKRKFSIHVAYLEGVRQLFFRFDSRGMDDALLRPLFRGS